MDDSIEAIVKEAGEAWPVGTSRRIAFPCALYLTADSPGDLAVQLDELFEGHRGSRQLAADTCLYPGWDDAVAAIEDEHDTDKDD